MPTRQELSECPHVDMCSQDQWNPQSVKLQSLKMKNPKMLQLDDESFAYLDPTDDEAILHSMKGSPNGLRERIIEKIGVPELEDHHVKTDLPMQRTFVSNERHSQINADMLAEKFGISPSTAKRTMNATLQRGVRSAILPLSRRYKADRIYSLTRLNGEFATDTYYGKTKSLLQNTKSQI